MSLVKYQRSNGMAPLASVVNRLFDDFLPGVWSESESGTFRFRPSVDVIEENDHIAIKADMPGMDRKDIKVTVADGVLTIEGSRSETREEKKDSYARTERFMGTFCRSFNLPRWADGSRINADYKNGVLTVTVPKLESARPKEIEVKVS